MMNSLFYLIDLLLALPLLMNGLGAFIAACCASVLISFSMRGYEGITISDKEKQMASTLGSAVMSCFVFPVFLPVSPFVALPALGATVVRNFIIYKRVKSQFKEESFMLTSNDPIEPKVAYDSFKRLLDVGIGVILLVLFSPVTVIVSLISLILEGRPIFICQTRIGKDCKQFGMYKFRTFDTKGNKETITKLGKFLRPLRLDELPQIINIIKGDMSLAGPRPELPSFHKLGMDNIEDYSSRLLVKPGLTGWAQINYKYTTTLEEYRIKTAFDLYYVKNRSFILDIKCLFKTPFAVFLTLLKKED